MSFSISQNQWYSRFFMAAQTFGKLSQDPESQIGAIIVDPDFKLLSMGFQTFVDGTVVNESLMADKALKHKFLLHPEEVAILDARCSLNDCSIFLNWFPCHHCAKMIIYSGIVKVFTVERNKNIPGLVASSMTLSEQMFQRAGVEVHAIKSGEFNELDGGSHDKQSKI